MNGKGKIEAASATIVFIVVVGYFVSKDWSKIGVLILFFTWDTSCPAMACKHPHLSHNSRCVRQMMMQSKLLQTIIVVLLHASPSMTLTGFVFHSKYPPSPKMTTRIALFKDLFGQAFENDPSLSKENVRDGMLDAADTDEEVTVSSQTLTRTQIEWRRKMLSKGGVSNEDLIGTVACFDLYLTGIPNKDPSNDLFGSKTNISSRDREVGQVLPTTPSVSAVRVKFAADQVCEVLEDSSGFVNVDSKGDWRLSDDGEQIRFRFKVNGFTRTIETKGTIQKVYWSNEEEKSTRTQTVYSIPEGWLYGEGNLKLNGAGKPMQWNEGVLKVEQSTGLLGVSTKMIPCGKFTSGVSPSSPSSEVVDQDISVQG